MFCYYFAVFLAVKWALSAATCDCSISFKLWQGLLISTVWCLIEAFLPALLLYRLKIPRLQDQLASCFSLPVRNCPASWDASTLLAPVPLTRSSPRCHSAPETFYIRTRGRCVPCCQLQLSCLVLQCFREERGSPLGFGVKRKSAVNQSG